MHMGKAITDAEKRTVRCGPQCHKAAAILVDRTVASALIFENNWSNDVKRYYPLKFETKNIHYILSKKSVSQKTVKEINASIMHN